MLATAFATRDDNSGLDHADYGHIATSHDKGLLTDRLFGGPVRAIGFAWAAQQAEDLPLEPTDQTLDMVVTEQGTAFAGAGSRG